jgi:hypothetical protein
MRGPTINRRKSCTNGILNDIEGFCRGEKLKYEMDMDYISRMTR